MDRSINLYSEVHGKSAPQATTTAPPSHFTAFESGGNSAAIAVFVFALLATLALSAVLIRVLWVLLTTVFKRTSNLRLTPEAFFFRSQLGQYAGCLLLSNLIRNVSGLINIRWISAGGVTTESACVTQGVLNQIGQFGTYFFTVMMGVHTFNTLVLRNKQPQWLGMLVTAIGWAAAISIGAGPLAIRDGDEGSIYNDIGFTCGFSNSYQLPHLLLYFLPLSLASLLSAVVYSIIFLVLRGILTINGGLRFQIDPERRLRTQTLNGTFEGYQRFIYSISRTMPWFPITFVLTSFPSSVVQLIVISGSPVSTGAMAFSYILEQLEGVLNVIILINVLRVLGRAMRSTSAATTVDREKGQQEQGPVSRSAFDWKQPLTLAPPKLFFARNSLSQVHKKSGSVASTTGLLARDLSASSHGHSASTSVEGAELSAPQQPIASVLDGNLTPPPNALQLHTNTLHLTTETSALQNKSKLTGLTPSPRPKRAPVSINLSPILGSPTDAPLQHIPPPVEVGQHSPPPNVSPTDVGSVINMYLSDKPTPAVELPRFPTPAVQRGSSPELLSFSHIHSPAFSTTSFRATPSIDRPLVVLPEGAIRPLKSYVSVGAVGGGKPPLSAGLPASPSSYLPVRPSPAPPLSPTSSIGTIGRSPSRMTSHLPSPRHATIQLQPPRRPTHLNRSTSADATVSLARDSTPLERPQFLQPVRDHRLPRTPLQARPPPPRFSSARLYANSNHSRRALSATSHYGYI